MCPTDGAANGGGGGGEAGEPAAAAAVKEEGGGARGLAMALHRQDEGAIPDMITVIQTKMGQDSAPAADGAAAAGGTDAAAADAAGVVGEGAVEAATAAAAEEAAMPMSERNDSGLSESGVKESRFSADQLALGRMPDQDFKYFRLVLMQETLYAKMLDGWEQRMGVDLVRDSLSMLRMARKGLSQRELEELLQIEETGRTAAWRDLAEALHTDIRVKSEGLLGFVYSAFRLAVERRYLRTEADRRRLQLRLAEYFERQHTPHAHEGGSDAPSQMVAVPGKAGVRLPAQELPYVLEGAGEWKRLRKCLSASLDMLHQLYNDKDKGDLLRFWRHGDAASSQAGYEDAAKCYSEQLNIVCI